MALEFVDNKNAKIYINLFARIDSCGLLGNHKNYKHCIVCLGYLRLEYNNKETGQGWKTVGLNIANVKL